MTQESVCTAPSSNLARRSRLPAIPLLLSHICSYLFVSCPLPPISFIMRASTSSSDSMTGILTSTTRNHDPRHSQYGPSTLLNFFFHRVVRGGPKLLLYPAVLIATMFLMAEFMPTGFSSTLASSTSHLWQFRPGGRRKADAPSIDGNALDAVVGGGLRIVVFGERDIATVPAPNSFNSALDGGINATSWTVELCREVCFELPVLSLAFGRMLTRLATLLDISLLYPGTRVATALSDEQPHLQRVLG